MLSFLRTIETPMAYAAFGLSTLTVYWQSVGNVSFLPGFDQVFQPGKDSSQTQYPRPQNLSWEWTLYYFLLYGVWGTFGQYNGLKISTDQLERRACQKNEDFEITPKTSRRAKKLASFHIAMSIHHIAWCLVDQWGRLDVSSFGIPGLTAAFGISSMWCGWHALQLWKSKSLEEITRHKALLDCISLSTIISTLAFLPTNTMGVRNRRYEQIMWTITGFCPFGLLVVDAKAAMKTDDNSSDAAVGSLPSSNTDNNNNLQ